METPPASAMSHSPLSRLWQARWTATSEVEQAVCTPMAGPRRFSLYETRVAGSPCRCRCSSAPWSSALSSALAHQVEQQVGVDGGAGEDADRRRSEPPARSRRAPAPPTRTRGTRGAAGSISSASRGVKPKNPASNSSMPSSARGAFTKPRIGAGGGVDAQRLQLRVAKQADRTPRRRAGCARRRRGPARRETGRPSRRWRCPGRQRLREA